VNRQLCCRILGAWDQFCPWSFAQTQRPDKGGTVGLAQINPFILQRMQNGGSGAKAADRAFMYVEMLNPQSNRVEVDHGVLVCCRAARLVGAVILETPMLPPSVSLLLHPRAAIVVV